MADIEPCNVKIFILGPLNMEQPRQTYVLEFVIIPFPCFKLVLSFRSMRRPTWRESDYCVENVHQRSPWNLDRWGLSSATRSDVSE